MVLNPNFFLPGTDHLLKVQARMEDKVRIKNLNSLLAFFDKFSRVPISNHSITTIYILPTTLYAGNTVRTRATIQSESLLGADARASSLKINRTDQIYEGGVLLLNRYRHCTKLT